MSFSSSFGTYILVERDWEILHLRRSLIHIHSCRIFFQDLEFRVERSFLSLLNKMLFNFLLAFLVSDGKNTVIPIVNPRSDVSFFSTCYLWGYFFPLAKSHQSCPTLCDPIDSSPPGFDFAYLGVYFFGFVLFGCTQSLESGGLCLLPNLECFQWSVFYTPFFSELSAVILGL